MKKIIIIILTLLLISIGTWYLFENQSLFFKPRNNPSELTASVSSPDIQNNSQIEVILTNLTVPWEIAWLPDGQMLITERPGRLLLLNPDKNTIEIQGVEHIGEGGLMGLAVDPDFNQNQYLYLYYTTRKNDQLINQLIRYQLKSNTLINQTVLLTDILGASYHDGGRIEFGPDNRLYITTGDAGQPELAQDTDSLNGKILRINKDGSIPEDNPFDNPVYSYGHRNPQGLAWDSQGRLWSTEHGPSGVNTGNDELNLIKPGQNYGWPEIVGSQSQSGMQTPIINSGDDDTWAPAGLDIKDNTIVFAGLRGQALYTGKIQGEQITDFQAKYFQTWGRLRAVRLGPDGYWYISTSNQDGRGQPVSEDDRIIKIKRL